MGRKNFIVQFLHSTKKFPANLETISLTLWRYPPSQRYSRSTAAHLAFFGIGVKSSYDENENENMMNTSMMKTSRKMNSLVHCLKKFTAILNR